MGYPNPALKELASRLPVGRGLLIGNQQSQKADLSQGV